MISQTISHYKILAKLGEGGMGVVYKAEDTKLKRAVALKFLPSSIMASEAEKTRFVHEAQAAAALNHPNICTIYEIDEADGQSFIAMELVEGQSLKEKIEAGPLKLDEAINIAGQIAEGLQAAHEKKITHRDIKPANIMLTPKGQAKIMDFGLAKQSGRTVVTKEGMTLGTVAYMSPEQARGEDIDHRTDIWALGVVLHEMITGQMPFKGVYEQAVVYSILNENPEPLTGLRTGVPMELERMVNKCLDKLAAQRYQHADDLLADLRRLQLEPQSATRLAPKTAIVEPPKKSSRRLALPLAIVAVAVILGVGYLFFSREAESKERIPIAVVDFINETEDKELNGLSGMLITALEQSQRLSVVTRSRMFDILKQMGTPGADHIDEVLGKEICQRANVTAMAIASIRKFDQLYTIDLKVIDPIKDKHLFAGSEKGEGKASVPVLIDKLAERTRKGLKEQEAEIQAASPRVADITTPNLEAYQHYFLGEQAINKLRFDAAAQEFEKAVALDSTFALAYYRLAYALAWKMEHLGKAPLQKALRLSDRLPEKERYFVRVEQARLEGGWKAALEILKEMESRYPNEKEMLFQIGDYSFHAGEFATAREYFEKVLAMDSTFARAVQHIIWVYREAGESQNMLAMAERYHAFSPSQESYMLLGQAYIGLGDFDKAAEALQRAKAFAPQSWQVAQLMAEVYIFQEKFGQAEAELKPYLAENQPFGVRFSAHLSLASAYPYVGKYRETLRLFDGVIEMSWQAHDTADAALWYLAKGFYFWEGWKDAKGVKKEIEETLPFQNKLSANVDYWINRISLHASLGDFALADSLDQTKAELWAQNLAGHLSLLSYAHSLKRECVEAENSLSASLDAGLPQTIALWNFFYLAQCHFAAGKLDDAVQWLQKIPAIYDNNFGNRQVFYPKRFYLLGKIYEQKGDKRTAIENYEKLLELWKDADKDLPELIDAKARLANLKGVVAK